MSDMIKVGSYENKFAKVENIVVYGLENSMKVSGYPMVSDINVAKEQDTAKRFKRATVLGNAKSGSGHDCFLKGIIVQFDLTLSQTAWCQLQRYHFIDFVSSCSKMHSLKKMDLENCFNPYITEEVKNIVRNLSNIYNVNPTEENFKKLLYNVPLGFKLTAGMTTNYLQLKTIYNQRKHHRLSEEWGLFCEALEHLPLFKELCLGE